MLSSRPARLLLAALVLAAPASSRAADVGNQECVECGLRRPGQRPRELAILESVVARLPSSAPWDFAAAERLGTPFARPTAAEAEQLSPGSALLRAMNQDPITFTRIRYLMPDHSRIVDGQRLQGLIDDAVAHIASTEAGRKAVCPFQGEGGRTIRMYFQVSDAAAKQIDQGCRGFPVPDAVKWRLRVMSEMNPPSEPAKKFVFLLSDGPRPPIEGYTARNNTTYLVLTKETFNADTLQRMIAHEVAVSYDQLSRFGYHANVQSLEDQGTPLGWGKGPFDNVFENPGSPAELERMKCGFRDPAVRYAATAQRAFVFEDAVSAELGGSPAVEATGTCSQILAKNSVLLQAMARTVSWDTGWYEAGCGIAKDPAARLQQILSRIHDVETSSLTCKDPKDCGGRKKVSLCEVLLHPRIGPNTKDLDSGGPRPRMGGGWDDAAVEREDLIVRASAGERLTPSQVKELGDALLFPNIDELHREEDAQRAPTRPRDPHAAADGVSL